MDIRLDKDMLQDIDRSSEIEWIEKNDFGFYSSSSCIGMNTRREHGIFVVPDNSQKKKIVLLSKLEESIFIDTKLHDISTNQYNTGIYPSGYTYLEKFSIDPFPCYTFKIEGRVVEKTVFLLSNYPMLVVRYELKNKGVPVNIIVKPFIAERFATEITKDLQGLNTDSYLGHQFVRWAIKPNMPELYVYYSQGEFDTANLWYKNFIYPKDVGRYDDSLNENLFNPGFFKATLKSYQVLDLFISIKELEFPNLDYESFYRTEKNSRKVRQDSFKKEHSLARMSVSLSKSVKKIQEQTLVSVSSLDNKFTTREIIFSLPGLFLVNKEYDNFKTQFKSLIEQLSEGLLPVHSPVMRDKNHSCAADLSLWLINLGYTYFSQTKDLTFFDSEVIDGFQSIIDFYTKGTLHNIQVDKDNLVFSGNKKSSTSWIPLKDKNGEILRYGKLMEINALWYNAIMVYSKLNEALGKKWKSSKYNKLGDKIKQAFNETFVNNDGSILDFVLIDSKNKDFRINQIIPLALPFSPLEDGIAQLVMDQVEKVLLTPYGLRSSKPDKGLKDQIIHRKSKAFYSGAIWPWAISIYVNAALRYAPDKKQKAIKLKSYFAPLETLINSGLINYMPEAITFDGQPEQKGITDFTPSLASFIWASYLLIQEINKK